MGWFEDARKKVEKEGQKVAQPVQKAVTTIAKPVQKAVKTVSKPVSSGWKTVTNTAGQLDPTGIVRGANKGFSNMAIRKSFKENAAGFLDNTLGGDVGKQIFGSRGPGERLGVTPTSGPYAPKNENIPDGGPRSLSLTNWQKEDVVSGSQYSPSFKGEDEASWKGIVQGNENDPTAAIGRRFKLLQSNLKASEGAQAQMEQDAIARRFASMGGNRSGAAQRASMLQSDAAARRLGQSRNALMAEQAGMEANAMESANARNLQREQLKLSSEEARRGRAVQQAQLDQDSFFRGKELDLNQKIAFSNMEIAREELARDKEGMLKNLFTDIFGGGYSLKNPNGPLGYMGPFPWVRG